MSYYHFNRQEILQKAKEKYSKEYYLKNKEVIKEKARSHYRNLPEEEKNKIKELIQCKKEALKNK